MTEGSGTRPLLLMEEAINLLRRTPLSTLALYYVGAVPFVLMVLFFIVEMSVSPFALAECSTRAFGLVVGYIWMRCWQSICASRIRAELNGEPPVAWTRYGLGRLILLHTAWSTLGCAAIPISMVLLLPLPWVYGFHQNLATMNLVALCNDREQSLADITRQSRQLASLWPAQNAVGLLLISLFRTVVWTGILLVLISLPGLISALLGIDTAYAQSGFFWMLNSTFISVTLALTYLALDPLVKAIYLLRCFYGEALRTGGDLVAELRQARRRRATAGALAAALFCFGVFGFQQVEGAQGEGRAKPVLPELQDIETLSLDEALDEAMQRKEFAWRMPRDLVPVPEEDKNIFVRFADSMTEFVRKSIQDGMDWLEAFVKKIFTDQDSISGSGGNSFSTAAIVKGVSIIMLGIMGLLIAWTILRSRRQRKVAVEEIATAYAVPDLDDESVVASALPEEEWLGLARDLRAEGELRKAVRAYFLAGLASLGRVEVVRIARFKSNREYQRELQRRAYRCPGAAEPFSDSIRRFEQIWYGLYEVSDSELDEMADVVNQVRHRCVSPSGEDK